MADKIYFQPKADADEIRDFYGPKNLISFRIPGVTTSSDNLTYNFGDGDVITVNGTANNSSALRFTNILKVKAGTYKVSCGLSQKGSDNTFRIRLGANNLSKSDTIKTLMMYDGLTYDFTLEEPALIWFSFYYNKDVTISNLQFKPFIAFSKVSNTFTVNGDYNQLGRNISDKLTSGELYSSISDGIIMDPSCDIKVGNIITGPTTKTDYYIGHLDYWYGYSNIGLASTHHVIIFPTKKWLGETGKMNATNTTEGGYWGSTGREEVDALAQQYFVKDFGSHIKPFKNILTTAVKDGATSTWEWKENRYADLMSEAMIHGTTVFANGGHNTGTQKEQLAIFREYGEGPVLGAQYFFNKDVASATSFAYVSDSGRATSNSASFAYGFLPFAVLTG